MNFLIKNKNMKKLQVERQNNFYLPQRQQRKKFKKHFKNPSV